MRKLVVAIAIVVGLMVLPMLCHAQTAPLPGQGPPVQVKLYWVTHTTAILTWIQTSDATEVFLSKSANNQWIALNGYPGKQSRQFIINLPGLKGPNDAMAFPHEGDVYAIDECKRKADDSIVWCREYGVWELGPPPIFYYLPLIRH